MNFTGNSECESVYRCVVSVHGRSIRCIYQWNLMILAFWAQSGKGTSHYSHPRQTHRVQQVAVCLYSASIHACIHTSIHLSIQPSVHLHACTCACTHTYAWPASITRVFEEGAIMVRRCCMSNRRFLNFPCRLA